MWEKQCHKPLMTANGKHATYSKMVMMTGGWCLNDIVLPTLQGIFVAVDGQ